ncbi:MAG TPA: nicotinate-nucleotide adenylyltransferase [Bryobacteraceae bacterium]|jgi:nicotinate-nucleotide adenylyltransferase|nr:nicotinate-nucleotide adenylyltransferase [Bryobacteraceae bacterium]
MRLALFGGTFDPIHNAHLTVAREAADQFQLDQVWFIPAAHPPHKAALSGANYEDRYRMTELACQADPRFVASRLEEGEKKSYTIDTIQKVRTQGENPYFIIGADAFAEITSWHRWQDLLGLTEFIVVTRPGHHYSAPPTARVHRLDTIALPISSSDIRRRLAAGQAPPQLPVAVAGYIAEKGLYHFTRGEARPVSQP